MPMFMLFAIPICISSCHGTPCTLAPSSTQNNSLKMCALRRIYTFYIIEPIEVGHSAFNTEDNSDAI